MIATNGASSCTVPSVLISLGSHVSSIRQHRNVLRDLDATSQRARHTHFSHGSLAKRGFGLCQNGRLKGSTRMLLTLGHVSASEEKVGLLLERLAARSFSKEENAFPWTEPHLKRLRSPRSRYWPFSPV